MPHPFIRIIIIINNINGRSSPPYFLIIYEFIILFHLLNWTTLIGLRLILNLVN